MSAHVPEPVRLSEEAAQLHAMVKTRLEADGPLSDADRLLVQRHAALIGDLNWHANDCAMATARINNGRPKTKDARVLRLEAQERELERWEAESVKGAA